MGSYEHDNVYGKIVSLEDKVSRLEEIISYGNRDKYRSKHSHYNRYSQPHYQSAIHLSKATHNLKQDLLYNPHHKKMGRKSYQQIYDRVSILEDELQDIIQYMERERSMSGQNYSGRRSQSIDYYDQPSGCRACDNPPKKRIIRESPKREMRYNRYVELIPSDTSSSETIEEIVYYVESSSTSSSSSSVIFEEYVPKTYTRRSFREAPFIDVSKSKPRPSVEKSPPKSKRRHKRKSEPKIKINKQPKERNRKIRVTQSESNPDIPDEKSEIFLVKRSIDSSKSNKNPKNKTKKQKEKYAVARLKRPESSSDEEETKNKRHNRSRSSPKQKVNKAHSDKNVSKAKNKTSKNKQDRRHVARKVDDSEFKERSNKRKAKKKSSPRTKQSVDTISVAYSSYVLNDPFVRTIFYDDLESSGEGNIISFASNKSDSGLENVSKISIPKTSIYEMGNSIYSFDPFFKQRGKFYFTDKQSNSSLLQNSTNISGKKKSKVYKVKENDVIILNDDSLKSHQQKFTFKLRKKPTTLEESGPWIEKKKYEMSSRKLSSGLDEDSDNERIHAKKPLAHSVYLTTVPIYQTGFNNAKRFGNITESTSKRKNTSKTSNVPLEDVADEILMNVARKLSPVVAEIITTKYLHRNENYTTQSEPLVNKPHIESHSHHSSKSSTSKSSSKLNISGNRKVTNSSFIVKKSKLKEHRQELNSENMENEGSTELINVLGNYPLQSIVYLSKIEDSSPLQEEENSKNTGRKSSLNKTRSLSGLKKMFSKDKPGLLLKNKESVTGQRASQIFKKQNVHGSQNRRSISNMADDQKEQPSQSLQSLDRMPQKKKSILRTSTTNIHKTKSTQGLKGIIRKVIHKEPREPALKQLVNKVKSRKNTPEDLKKDQSEALRKPSRSISSEQNLKQGSFIKQKFFRKRQDQSKKPSHLKVPSVQELKEEPTFVLMPNSRDGPSRSSLTDQEAHNSPNFETDYAEHDMDGFNGKFVGEGSSGSRENPNQGRRVSSQYNKTVKRNSGQKETRSSPSEDIQQIPDQSQKIRRMSLNEDQAQYSRPSFQMDRNISSVDEARPEINETVNVRGEETYLHELSETPKLVAEPEYKSLKPLNFCIHFSKEKRSKFESQSTSSLDNILSSNHKKVHSSEDMSLSEYAFDKNSKLYTFRKFNPENPRHFFRRQFKTPSFPNRGNSAKSHDLIKGGNFGNDCCCKNWKITKSEQLISDVPGTYLNWHRVANEIKHAN